MPRLISIRRYLLSLCLATVAAAQSVTPASLSFGSQVVGTTSAPQSTTFTNTSGQTLVIPVGISISGDFQFYATTCNTMLIPGASCSISVTFEPSAIGSRTGTLEIFETPGATPFTVQLTGTGI
ncbi:MAG TPA: choice-of-anchor D domain-containing protein, partial [Bryobacteraceae bacterium]|nr:choice-of-anchor D domain-containing protein [Bryobacteraceae bacterium]